MSAGHGSSLLAVACRDVLAGSTSGRAFDIAHVDSGNARMRTFAPALELRDARVELLETADRLLVAPLSW